MALFARVTSKLGNSQDLGWGNFGCWISQTNCWRKRSCNQLNYNVRKEDVRKEKCDLNKKNPVEITVITGIALLLLFWIKAIHLIRNRKDRNAYTLEYILTEGLSRCITMLRTLHTAYFFMIRSFVHILMNIWTLFFSNL